MRKPPDCTHALQPVMFLVRWLIAFALASCSGLVLAQAHTEAQVKAAYVLNFAKFTDWPAKAPVAADASMAVCVIGNQETVNGFASIEGKAVHAREVRVRSNPPLVELSSCHVLYIDAAERASVSGAFKAASNRPILTVSDALGFVDAGGMLGLVMVDGRIRFDANREAAQTVGLRLRAQLLALARTVR